MNRALNVKRRGNSLAVGVDFGGTRIKLGLVDEAGDVIAREMRPTPRGEGPEAVLDALVDGVKGLFADSVAPAGALRGVGLGTPGPLDAAGERVLFAPNVPGWEEIPLKSLLAERLGLPVRLENDANAAALGEYWTGAGRGARTLIFLGLGTGVGGGIILDGRLWRGAHGAGAELGHVTLLPEGESCGCGNRGCLETLAAAPAIIRGGRAAIAAGKAPRLAALAEEAGRSGGRAEPSPELVARAAMEGEAAAQDIYSEVGRWLGVAVAAFMNIFDPEVVVIGGGVAGSAELLLPALREEACRRSFAVIYRRVRIVAGRLGDDAGVVGAAAPFFLEEG